MRNDNIILDYIKKHPELNNTDIARLIIKENKGKYSNVECVRKLVSRWKNKGVSEGANKINYKEGKDNAEIDGVISTTQKDKAKILDDFLLQCKVDLQTWEVERYVLNAWDVTMKIDEAPQTSTNYQIKVWLKRKTNTTIALENTINNLRKHNIKIPVIKHSKFSTDIMYEICLFDNHFGKLAWQPEVGEDYDLVIAKKRYLESIVKFKEYAKIFPPKQILFPIGNDFLHINNEFNTTEKGTKQDVDGRLAKIFNTAFETILESIEILRGLAPIHMLWVASNHDLNISYYLCKTIEAYYHNCKQIKIDTSPNPIKYYKWGAVLLMFEHGQIKPDKMLNIMADQCKDIWADVIWKEAHVGHWHKKKEMIFTSVDTFQSITYRVIPSMTATDYWHYQHGFVGSPKSADAFVWSKEKGLLSNFHIYLEQ